MIVSVSHTLLTSYLRYDVFCVSSLVIEVGVRVIDSYLATSFLRISLQI